jgi:importin subunit alpha-2
MTINVQEMRRRRTEVYVELRKAKQQDHLLKRRNLEVDYEPLSPLQEHICMAAANMIIEDIVNGQFYCII